MSYRLFIKLFQYKKELKKFLIFIIGLFILYFLSPFIFQVIENRFGKYTDTIYHLLLPVHLVISVYLIHEKICKSIEREMVFLKMLALDNITIFQVLFIRQISTYYILCASYILFTALDDFYSVLRGIFAYSFIYFLIYMLSNILMGYIKILSYIRKIWMISLFIVCILLCFYGVVHLNEHGFDINALLERLQFFFLNNRIYQFIEVLYLKPTFILIILNFFAYVIIRKVILSKCISYQVRVKKIRNIAVLDKFYFKNHNMILFHIKREYAIFLRSRSMMFFKILWLMLFVIIAILSADPISVTFCAGFFIIILVTAQQFIYKAEVCNKQLYKQLPYTYNRFLINKILCGWLYTCDGIIIILFGRLLIAHENLYYGVGILLFSLILDIYVNIIFSSYYTKMKASDDIGENIFIMIISLITFIPGAAFAVGAVSYIRGKREWKIFFEGLDENVNSR